MNETYSLILAVVLALAAAMVLIFVLRRPADAVGLMDEPDHRKRHAAPAPLVGGLAVVPAAGLGVWLLGINGVFTSLWLGAMLLLAIGVVDDTREVSPWYRLVVQILAALLVVSWAGLDVHNLGNLYGAGAILLGGLSGIFTITSIVFMTNALNMMDGLDGLAGGIAWVMFLAFALAGLSGGAGMDVVAVCLLLVAALTGFLVFNIRSPWRERASVFMGDGGSMVLGFAAAWMAVYLAGPRTAPLPPVVMAWILALPAMDMLAVFMRRLAKGRNPLTPDRTHMHHLLHRCGFSVQATVWMLIGLEAVFCLVGVGGWALGVSEPVLGIGILVVFGLHFLAAMRIRSLMRLCRRRRAARATRG